MHSLETMRLSKPVDFWRLLRRPTSRLKVDPTQLFSHYQALLESPAPTGAPEEFLPLEHSPAGDFTVSEVEAAIHSMR
jgi:hypothetical protein